MKVAILQRFLPGASRGGVGHFTHGLANALVQRGHEVTVFTRDPLPPGARYQIFQINPDRPKSRWDSLRFPFDAAQCDFSSFDVLHAQGDEQWIPKKKPVVRTMHGSAWVEAYYNGVVHFSPKHFLLHLHFYFSELIADLRADFVAVVSKDTARYYPRTHAVLGNGIDFDLYSQNRAAKAGHPVVLFVGDLYSRKRGDLLVKIFQEEVRPKIPASELWLVSPEKKEGEGIRWFSGIDSHELARLYQQAWVFCLPSSYEGFGRPYIEAMAAGTAVLATPNPGACEVLEGGKYGRIARDEKIGSALRELLTQNSEREKYAALGPARAREYDWSVIASGYEEIYKKLTNAV